MKNIIEIQKEVFENVLNNIKIDTIVEIMKSFNWKYYNEDDNTFNPISKESVINTLKEITYSVVNNILNFPDRKENSSTAEYGGFRATADINKNGIIEVKVEFIPMSVTYYTDNK
jgi:hypothetical protein